jgi:hypothetical protein
MRLSAGGPRFALVPFGKSAQPASRRQPLRQRLLRELADVGSGGRDVEEGALDGGDAETVSARDLVVGEAEAVEAELVCVTALPWQRNVDRDDGRPQPVGHQGARMAKGGEVATGQQRRAKHSPHRERTQCVDLVVYAPVTAGRDPVVDRFLTETRR